MTATDENVTRLTEAIKKRWPQSGNPKVDRYVGRFWNRQRHGVKITGDVAGNHGDYTVSIEAAESGLSSACSCYIGKHGYCHHCVALGQTFLTEPGSFHVIEAVEQSAVDDLDTLQTYLDGVTLDELMKQLRSKGITQKAFCEAIGMSSRHLSAVKSSEKRNRRFHELGAIKVAVLWAMEHLVES